MEKGIMDRKDRMMNMEKFLSFIRVTVLSPNTSIRELFVPFKGGGVSGRNRFNAAASRLTPAPQKKGIFVPSKGRFIILMTTMLKMEALTQPMEPNTLILGKISEGAWVMAMELVSPQVGIWQNMATRRKTNNGPGSAARAERTSIIAVMRFRTESNF
jgi:hypothetical protein